MDGPEFRAINAMLKEVAATAYFKNEWVKTGEFIRQAAVNVAAAACNFNPAVLSAMVSAQGRVPYKTDRRDEWIEQSRDSILASMYERAR